MDSAKTACWRRTRDTAQGCDRAMDVVFGILCGLMLIASVPVPYDNWPCEPPRYCNDGSFYADPLNCQCFYVCSHNVLIFQCCGNGTLFDSEGLRCDYPILVQCQQPCPTEAPYTGTPYSEQPPQTGPCEKHAAECSSSSANDPYYYPDMYYCEDFYRCQDGSLDGPYSCIEGLVFDFRRQLCDSKTPEIDCEDRCQQDSSFTTEPLSSTREHTTQRYEDASVTVSTTVFSTQVTDANIWETTRDHEDQSRTDMSTAGQSDDVPGDSLSAWAVTVLCVTLSLLVVLIIAIVLLLRKQKSDDNPQPLNADEKEKEPVEPVEKEPPTLQGHEDGHLTIAPSRLQTKIVSRTMYLPDSEDSKGGQSSTSPVKTTAFPHWVAPHGHGWPGGESRSTGNPSTGSSALGHLVTGNKVEKLLTISESVEEDDGGVLTHIEHELRKGLGLHRGDSISLTQLRDVGTQDERGEG